MPMFKITLSNSRTEIQPQVYLTPSPNLFGVCNTDFQISQGGGGGGGVKSVRERIDKILSENSSISSKFMV